MNFRRHARPEVFGFQIAPMVDILLVLLIFFIITWNFSMEDKELDVKIPAAANAKNASAYVGQVIVTVKKDGAIYFNKKQVMPDELVAKLQELARLFPDQAVILYGDQDTNYKFIVNVLDICRKANIWNIAFAASAPPVPAPTPNS